MLRENLYSGEKRNTCREKKPGRKSKEKTFRCILGAGQRSKLLDWISCGAPCFQEVLSLSFQDFISPLYMPVC